MSIYERCLATAARNKATHAERMAALVTDSAQKPDGWRRFDDGRGGVDTAKVERQASPYWWQYREYWTGSPRGCVSRQTEAQAIHNVRTAAKEAEPQQHLYGGMYQRPSFAYKPLPRISFRGVWRWRNINIGIIREALRERREDEIALYAAVV